MALTSATVRMDEDLKKRAEMLFEDMGLSMTTAFTIFVKAAIRQNIIPFEIAGDTLYCERNQSHLNEEMLGSGVHTTSRNT